MPIETRTCDGRHYARRVVQHHDPLPLVRFDSPFERRRRRRRAVGHILVIFAGAALLFAVSGLLWREFLTW